MRRFNLKTSGSYESLEEIGATVVARAATAASCTLRDVAEVGWAAEEERYIGRFNGQRARCSSPRRMKDNQNIFDVRDGDLRAQLRRLRAGPAAPASASSAASTSRANVDRRLSRLSSTSRSRSRLVMLTLLPLGLRAAGIVMISIPLSLAIGLVALLPRRLFAEPAVDRGLRASRSGCSSTTRSSWSRTSRATSRQGMTRREAAIAATDQIWLAVLGCTVTLLFAFVPLLFLPEAPATSSARCRRRCCSRSSRRSSSR